MDYPAGDDRSSGRAGRAGSPRANPTTDPNTEPAAEGSGYSLVAGGTKTQRLIKVYYDTISAFGQVELSFSTPSECLALVHPGESSI